MHIVFAASECVPYAKTGGVAEVVGALPKELVRQGHQVTVYVPLYRQVQKHLKERKIAIRSLTIPFSYYNRFVTVVDGGTPDGVQFYFIDCPELFDREFLYETASAEYADNAERFGLFCRAVLDSTKILGGSGCFSHSRLAGRCARDSAAHRLLLRSGAQERCLLVDDPQLRPPGMVFPRYSREAAPAVGCIHGRAGGVLRYIRFSEGRHRLLRRHHHGEPQICPGDSDSGVWQRSGWRVARSGAGSARHPEWSRLPGVGSGDRQQDRRPLHPGAAGREVGLPQGPAARVRCFQSGRETRRCWAWFRAWRRRKGWTCWRRSSISWCRRICSW